MNVLEVIAIVAEAVRVEIEHPYPYVGGIETLKGTFKPFHEYGLSGHKTDVPYDEEDPTLGGELVNSNELTEGGLGYTITDGDKIHCNNEGDLKRLVEAGKVPSDWMGELSSVGHKGETRKVSAQEEMLDALDVPPTGPYEIEDNKINWPMFVKARNEFDRGISLFKDSDPRKGKEKHELVAAYRKAHWHAGVLRDAGVEPVAFKGKYQPMVTTTEKMEEEGIWAVIRDGHLAESSLYGRNAWEEAQEALKADRARRKKGQRDRFMKLLEWVERAPFNKVREAFRWNREDSKKGEFHQRIASERAKRSGKDDAYLTSDQTVLLSMAAALKTGQRISERQRNLYDTACDSSPWEAWKVTGKGKYEIQWMVEESENPFGDETYIDYDIG